MATSLAVSEGEHSPLFGEEEAVASTLGVVAHRLVGLAFVGHEGERELPVGVEGLFLAHLRSRRPRLILRTSRRGVVVGVWGFGGCDQGGEGSEEGKQGHRNHHQSLLPQRGSPPSGPRPPKHLRAGGGSASYDARNKKIGRHRSHDLLILTSCGSLL